jgi:hypothetical protein
MFQDVPEAPRKRLIAVSDLEQADRRRRDQDPKPDSMPSAPFDGKNAPKPERLLSPQIYEASESRRATDPDRPSEKLAEPDGVSQKLDAGQTNAAIRERREARQANRARVGATVINMDELIAEAEREQQQKSARRSKPPDVSPLWEQRQRLKKMNLAEVKAFMRHQKQTQQSHPDGMDMDDLIADRSQYISKSGTASGRQPPLLPRPKRDEQFGALQHQPESSPGRRLLDSNALNASISHRAETIRAILEGAIGVEKLIALRQTNAQEALRGCAPDVVALAEELLELEQKLEAM